MGLDPVFRVTFGFDGIGFRSIAIATASLVGSFPREISGYILQLDQAVPRSPPQPPGLRLLLWEREY